MSDLNTPEDKLNWIFTAFDQVFIQRSIPSEFSVLSDFLYLLFEFLHLCLHHFTQDGGGSIDVEEIRDIVVGLFRFATN